MDDFLLLSLDKVPNVVYAGTFFLLCIIIVMSFLFCRSLASLKRTLLGAVLIEYLFLVLCTTVLCRDTTPVARMKLTPLYSYGEIEAGNDIFLYEVILNVVLFIPIGLIVSSFARLRHWWIVVLVGVVFSVCIELLQYTFHRGLCETDDVIHNTMGCLIGYLIFEGLNKCEKMISN